MSESLQPLLPSPLPLFPLQMVLFPGATLHLKVFEARYLDLMSDCLRTQQPFGVVCLLQGAEAGRGMQAAQIENVGTLAHLQDLDAEQPGILRVRCTAGERFRLQGTATQRDNGLWVASVQAIAPDPLRQPGPAMRQTVSALGEAITSCKRKTACPLRRPTNWTTLAGWPTAGASCCRCRWRPSKS